MGYENNHYIPQFIQRRFANKINRYNIITGDLIVKGSTKSAFAKKNIYPQWLEKMFGELEVRIAQFLDDIVLSAKEKVVLKRNDIWLIKKFFMIQTLRAPDSTLLRIKRLDDDKKMLLMGYKENVIENESLEDYAYRTLKVILESNSMDDVYNHHQVTFEACKWASLYNYCYITIWDSTECKEDFIITDNGMNCEHDKSRFQIFNFGDGEYLNEKDEMIKRGYIYSHLQNQNDYNTSLLYFNLEEKMKHVHANYYLFPVSATRTIALVNPFFRLFYDQPAIDIIGNVPDVWPTLLSREALESNKNRYQSLGDYSDDDLFYYDIKNLSLDDVIIINCMMMDRVFEWLGFAETSKMIRSLCTYLSLPKISQKIDYSRLKSELLNLGYDMPKGEYIKNMSRKLILTGITPSEIKYIQFFYDNLIKNKRNDI